MEIADCGLRIEHPRISSRCGHADMLFKPPTMPLSIDICTCSELSSVFLETAVAVPGRDQACLQPPHAENTVQTGAE
jgi:hypothetical protein